MRSRKVFRIYSQLPAAEREDFGLYLASPLFNQMQRLIDFRQVLESELMQQPGKSLSVEQTWALLPGEGEFRSNGFDKLCSELLARLGDFLALQAFRSHPATVASHTVEAYVDHVLDEWVPSLLDSQLERLGKGLERDSEGFYAHMRILEKFGEYLFRQPRTPHDDALLKIDSQLNLYFIAKKLELATLVETYNAAFNRSIGLPYMDMVRAEMEKVMDGFPLLVRLRALAWLLSSTQRDQYFWELKGLLLFTFREIAQEEARPIFQTALNHCFYRITVGQKEFEVEADIIQMTMLEQGLSLVDGKIPPDQMKNIVHMRLACGHVDWVEEFLEKWGHQLSHDHGGGALTFNRAVLAFHRQQYADCARGMENVLRDFKEDVYYGPAARFYQLMSLYELEKAGGSLPELESKIHALRMYLTRENRISEAIKARYLNLARLFRKLIALAGELEPERSRKARKILQEATALRPESSRDWIIRKFEELMQQAGPPS